MAWIVSVRWATSCSVRDLDVRPSGAGSRRVGHAFQRNGGVLPAVRIADVRVRSAIRAAFGLSHRVAQRRPFRSETYGRDPRCRLLVAVDMPRARTRPDRSRPSSEPLGQRPQADDRGDALGAWLAMPGGIRYQTPALEDESQRVQPPGHLARTEHQRR